MTPLRIRQLKVRGLRGCPEDFVLELKGKSLCLVGENGSGKTTLADAAELWGTGDLEAFHREGCGLGAAIHVDTASAEVELVGQGFARHRRILTHGGSGALGPRAPAAVHAAPPPPVPILRHGTIAEFMGQRGGEKKKALLALLGLERLTDLRDPLKTAAGRTKQMAEEATRAAAGERTTVELQLVGANLLAYADERRLALGLTVPVAAPADLLELELAPPSRAPAPDRPGAVDAVARALERLDEDPAAEWNRQVADERAIHADGLATLLHAAQRALRPDDTRCPVCEQAVVGAELAQRVAERAAELEAIRGVLAAAGGRLDHHCRELAELRGGLSALLALAPPGGWPHADALAQVVDEIGAHIERTRAARRDRIPCSPSPRLDDLRSALRPLRAAARSDADDAPRDRALIELTDLRQKCLRLDAAQRRRDAADAAHRAVRRMLALADEEIERAITDALGELGVRTADYYRRLVRRGPFTDVALVHRTARSGQVEFSLTFDGRHAGISPPQRIMSTSQLNALGLALLLARLHAETQPWRTLILDDVVNSFDADHRQGFARLLQEEFTEWQVIILTHDRAFKDILERTTSGWQFKEIAAFSPRTGPVLADANPRAELRRRLEDGMSALEVAHLARRALERGLGEPLRQLCYRIRYDPDQRYSAVEFLQALRRGLKHAGSPLKDLPVLARMETAAYLVNLGVHDRGDASVLTADDLIRLVEDLDELDAALRCADCGDPVWKERRGDALHCRCRALAA